MVSDGLLVCLRTWEVGCRNYRAPLPPSVRDSDGVGHSASI